MKCKMTFVLVALAAMSSAAFADDGKDPKGGGEHPTPGPSSAPAATRAISWDELRGRCEHPEQFDVQRAPQNIRVQCSDVEREYVAASEGELPLMASRRVQSAVYADKFSVTSEERDVPMVAKSGSCLRFKEVQRTLSVEKAIDCPTILGTKGDAADLCAAALDEARGSNPKLVEVTDTGKVIDTCPASADDGKGGDGGGNGKPGDGNHGGDNGKPGDGGHDGGHDGKPGDGKGGGK
jgi:hypothetical protein